MKNKVIVLTCLLTCAGSVQGFGYFSNWNGADEGFGETGKRVTGSKMWDGATFSDEQLIVDGSVKCRNTTFKNVIVNGSFWGRNVITVIAEIRGSCELIAGSLQELTVKGSAEVSDSTINGACVAKGSLKINNTACQSIQCANLTFENLTVTGSVEVGVSGKKKKRTAGSISGAKLTAGNVVVGGDCDITNGTVRSVTSNGDVILSDTTVSGDVKAEDEVRLKGKTIVEGDVIVESGKGKVCCDTAVVIKGKVVGAEVIKR